MYYKIISNCYNHKNTYKESSSIHIWTQKKGEMNQSLIVCGGLICIDITCEEKMGFRKRLAHACNLDIALPISVRAAVTRSVIYPMLEMGWASHLSKHISVGFTMIVGISLKLHMCMYGLTRLCMTYSSLCSDIWMALPILVTYVWHDKSLRTYGKIYI